MPDHGVDGNLRESGAGTVARVGAVAGADPRKMDPPAPPIPVLPASVHPPAGDASAGSNADDQARAAGSRSTRARPIATSRRPTTKLWVTVSPRIHAPSAAPDTGVTNPKLIIVLGR